MLLRYIINGHQCCFDMNSLVLSILIPSRNRATYLRSAIASALSINTDKIEIIVSDNFSSDESFAVANSFCDSRLRVVRPEKSLAMHEHWEFLLLQAKGRWTTFIGDDDGVMPHAASYLEYLESRYPSIEAIVSPRAYFYWESAYQYGDPARCSFSMTRHEAICDSKKQLQRCLRNEINYLVLPQMYGGGFHRRSLINRVFQAQGGHYFRSVTPDAYSALMGVLHTYRYLQVGIPLTWVGTSPAHSYGGRIKCAKDHQKDFVDMYSNTPVTMNQSFGSRGKWWPFGVYFFEAYISASPFTDLSQFSLSRIQLLSHKWCEELVDRGLLRQALKLSRQLGTKPLNIRRYQSKVALWRCIRKTYDLLRLHPRIWSIWRLLIGLRVTTSPFEALSFSADSTSRKLESIEDANIYASVYYRSFFAQKNESV